LQYTFEISVSGCNTKCAHCYVSGGPATPMPHEKFDIALKNLRIIIEGLEGEKAVTLGNEIFTHPNLLEILQTTHKILPEYSSYRSMGEGMPTTALALLNRKDKEYIIRAIKKMDCFSFDFTLLGGKTSHNAMVENELAFDALINFTHWTKEMGLEFGINLMMCKPLIEDWHEVAGFLEKFPGAAVSAVIPAFLPVSRLRSFQKYRAEYNDYIKLRGQLSRFGIDESDFFSQVDRYCERSVFDMLSSNPHFDYREDESLLPKWAFFNISNNYDIFYGNVGMHTLKLGNVLEDDAQELLKKIQGLPPNYDWSAYYDLNKLPPLGELLSSLPVLKTNYVYPRIQDCIYSWLDLRGIPSILT